MQTETAIFFTNQHTKKDILIWHIPKFEFIGEKRVID